MWSMFVGRSFIDKVINAMSMSMVMILVIIMVMMAMVIMITMMMMITMMDMITMMVMVMVFQMQKEASGRPGEESNIELCGETGFEVIIIIIIMSCCVFLFKDRPF